MPARTEGGTVWAVVVLTLACAGCGAEPTLDSIQAKVFDRKCWVESSCHDVDEAGGLRLDDGRAYEELLGAGGMGAPAEGDNTVVPEAVPIDRIRVIPFDPDNSYLIDKLENNLASNEGENMPNSDGTHVSDHDIAAIREWIAAGAVR